MRIYGLVRLAKDVEVRYSQADSSMAIARGSMASQRRYKREGQQDADFFNFVAYGKVAEFLEKYGKRGVKFFVEGRLENNNYTNKEGQKVYQDVIVIEQLEFAEKKETSGESRSYQPSARPTPSAASGDGFMNIPDGIDEELPFH